MPPASLLASSGLSLLVIFLLLGGAWTLARRLRRLPWTAKAGAQVKIDLTSIRSLGSQNMLAVAEVEGQRFLIGIGRNGVTRIGRLKDAPDAG